MRMVSHATVYDYIYIIIIICVYANATRFYKTQETYEIHEINRLFVESFSEKFKKRDDKLGVLESHMEIFAITIFL